MLRFKRLGKFRVKRLGVEGFMGLGPGHGGKAQAGSTLLAVLSEGLSVVRLGGPKMKSSLWLC